MGSSVMPSALEVLEQPVKPRQKIGHTAHQDPSKVDMFPSGRRRGYEKFLRGGINLDMFFITGDYHGGVDTNHDGMIDEDEIVPQDFFCPITQRPMTNPVTASDGNTYELKAIKGMFSTGMRISPVTGNRMPSTSLTPACELRQRIEDWVHAKVYEEEFHSH